MKTSVRTALLCAGRAAGRRRSSEPCVRVSDRPLLRCLALICRSKADTEGVEPRTTMMLLHNFDKRRIYGCYLATRVGLNIDASVGAEWNHQVRLFFLSFPTIDASRPGGDSAAARDDPWVGRWRCLWTSDGRRPSRMLRRR